MARSRGTNGAGIITLYADTCGLTEGLVSPTRQINYPAFRVEVRIDRMAERTSNVMLKAIEEPPPGTIWLLCAPSPSDVLVTIRSRCRPVTLRVPPVEAVAELLERRDGVLVQGLIGGRGFDERRIHARILGGAGRTGPRCRCSGGRMLVDEGVGTCTTAGDTGRRHRRRRS